jgi:hypothetical protein
VPKPNYGFEKRQKELAKQQKRLAKAERKASRAVEADVDLLADPTGPTSSPNQE